MPDSDISLRSTRPRGSIRGGSDDAGARLSSSAARGPRFSSSPSSSLAVTSHVPSSSPPSHSTASPAPLVLFLASVSATEVSPPRPISTLSSTAAPALSSSSRSTGAIAAVCLARCSATAVWTLSVAAWPKKNGTAHANASVLPLARRQIAGPGHRPVRPQPAPKIVAPTTSSGVMCLLHGSSNSHAATGCARARMARNAKMLKVTALRSTKARVGSQPEATSRKPMTRDGRVMPLTLRPTAKRSPMVKLRSTSKQSPAMRSRMEGRPSGRLAVRRSSSAVKRARSREMMRKSSRGSSGLDEAARTPEALIVTATPAPTEQNVATDTKDRLEKRGRPHTPWPLVQPLPSFVPTPTRSPPTAATGSVGSRGSAA
mmetsp:Transcript_16189/g.49539  ORF Transcript_16189/g.49539 Transcript_16189/m.49539 type:complete len:373 (+) Transcript_16189:160-1278(+)